MLLHPSGAGAPKEEPGVFAGYVGDSVDRCKQFPAGRYTISKKLGAGVYGKVLGCVDQKYNLPVAIKIVRKDPPIYRDAAKKEITVLRHLGGTHGCLRLLRDFEHDGHLCISMEMYGKNLQSFIKSRGKVRGPRAALRNKPQPCRLAECEIRTDEAHHSSHWT